MIITIGVSIVLSTHNPPGGYQISSRHTPYTVAVDEPAPAPAAGSQQGMEPILHPSGNPRISSHRTACDPAQSNLPHRPGARRAARLLSHKYCSYHAMGRGRTTARAGAARARPPHPSHFTESAAVWGAKKNYPRGVLAGEEMAERMDLRGTSGAIADGHSLAGSKMRGNPIEQRLMTIDLALSW